MSVLLWLPIAVFVGALLFGMSIVVVYLLTRSIEDRPGIIAPLPDTHREEHTDWEADSNE